MCWDTRIRTWKNRTRICCVTITPYPNFPIKTPVLILPQGAALAAGDQMFHRRAQQKEEKPWHKLAQKGLFVNVFMGVVMTAAAAVVVVMVVVAAGAIRPVGVQFFFAHITPQCAQWRS